MELYINLLNSLKHFSRSYLNYNFVSFWCFLFQENGRNVRFPVRCYWGSVSFSGIICLHCHLQQSSNEQSRLSLCYNINQLASDGNILHPSCRAAIQSV
ncbi:hypothetical protein SLE2022_197500 [Rubroshorea leprosula]